MRTLILLITFTAALGIPTGIATWQSNGLNARADAHRSRIERLEQRRVTIDLTPVYDRIRGGEERIEQCEARLADVRSLLDVMVREGLFKGRVHLPGMVSNWPKWSEPGAAYVWRKDGW